MRFTILAAAVAAATFTPLAAEAAVAITYAHVTNTYTSAGHADPSLEGTFVTLDSTNPGNSFNTVDRNVGSIFNLGTTTGTIHLQGTSAALASPSFIGGSTAGTVDFVNFGTFSLTPAIGVSTTNGGGGRGQMSIKNLDTNQSWNRIFTSPGNATVSGDLPTIAPAGNYEITWSFSGNNQAGNSIAGSMDTSLTFTPEPASLAALALPGLALRRRRR